MKSITVKLDQATLKQLKDIAAAKGFNNQSELVRRALKAYLAREALLMRKKAIAEYAADAGAQRETRQLAEAGMEDLDDYIKRIEGERDA
ncbi:ribbon-helix-helix domain-containing protein [Desulforudis sp. 1088]|uniref:ribbon-helix-helix domain-containing protein n=1 Tax=unclassified Candidatus Desulforudis TaxID=2635950 RepID=UPI003471465B